MDITKILNCNLNEINSNKENIRLIYLDKFQELNSDIQFHLLEINPSTLFYTNIQLCIDLIKSIINEEIFLIISNILTLDILDSIHNLKTLIAIFIYDNKQEINELNKIKYPKIIDKYINHIDLFKSIREKIFFIEKHFLIYNLFDYKQNSLEYLSKDSAKFLWYYMLINILKQIPYEDFQYNDLLNKCFNYYQTNHYELNNIELFRQTYTHKQVIQWYKNQCFLYKLLNHALYIKDIEYLYLFRFFIIDFYMEIEKEYKNIKKQEYFIVYHVQIMSNEEIEKFKQSIGYFISINNFLITTRDKTKSLEFIKENFSIYHNVLFEIHIENIFLTHILLSDNDIIININSLFIIDSIEYDSINNLWQIKILSNHNKIEFINEYLNTIQNQMNYSNSMIFFGHLLWNKLGELNQGKNFFQILFKLLPNDHIDIPKIYIELGYINDEIGDYNLALKNYQYALDIYEKQISKDYIYIALLLNNIGIVYKHIGNFDRSIDYFQQSLDIYDKKFSKNENHLYRANTITNLGLVYRDKHDFDNALTYFTLAYYIRRSILPNNHILIVNSLNNIGNIYHDKNDFNQALNYYQQALSIEEIIYPYDHINKSNTIRNIAIIYRDKQDWQNALIYFNRVYEIHQHQNSLDIAICYDDIGNIYEKMNNLDLSFDYYYREYEIEEQYLSFNHPNLILHFDHLINILKKNDQSDKAMNLCQKKLLYLKNILDNQYEYHPRIARLLVLIATIYEDKNPKQADQHYQQVLHIIENNNNQDIFQICLSTMTNFYWKCRMFDRALICQMKLLNLRRSLLSSNHNDIGYALLGLARLYRVMNKSNEALQYFDQSLNILQTNYGSEHIDVKNIQKEIYDLKDIIKSITSSPNEDYNNRRSSNAHKELLIIPQINSRSLSPISNYDKKTNSTISVSKSTTCIIL